MSQLSIFDPVGVASSKAKSEPRQAPRSERRKATRKSGQPTKVDQHHEKVAAKIIDMIRAGTAPWMKPWAAGQHALPHNLVSGHVYSGGNAVHLMAEMGDRGYDDPRWGTFKQIKKAGGSVRKGERGTHCLLFVNSKRVAIRDDNGKHLRDANGKKRYRWIKLERPYSRLFVVFNAAQADGLPARDTGVEAPAWQRHADAESVLSAHGVPVRNVVGDRAYYHIGRDEIVLPDRGQFEDADAYYQTALHELAHATGHADRLDREILRDGIEAGFGSAQYAREELRAEIASLMIGSRIGVGHNPDRGAAYVEGWLSALEDDPREVYRAAADAQRIANYVLDVEAVALPKAA